jgi:hypothetical protein
VVCKGTGKCDRVQQLTVTVGRACERAARGDDRDPH